MSKEIVIASSNEYNEASQRFREAWNEYQDQEEVVKYEIVNMVQILEHDGLNRTQAIQKVINDHKDLKGASRASIYRELPENMKDKTLGKPKKQLGQPNISREILGQPNNTMRESPSLKDFREQKGTKIQNNVMDQSGQTFDQKVTEESSSTSVEDVEDLRGTEQDIVYDPQFVDDLITSKTKLEESYSEYITPFQTTYLWTYKEQQFPLILKIDPYKKTVTSIELDEKEARKLNKK